MSLEEHKHERPVRSRRQFKPPKLGMPDEFTRVIWSWDRWLALHLDANKQLSPKLRKEADSLQRKLGKLMMLLNSD